MSGDRYLAFGRLGVTLNDLLNRHPHILEAFRDKTFTQRLIRLQGALGSLRAQDPALAPAISLLCCDYPMQTDVSTQDVFSLCRMAYDYSATEFEKTREKVSKILKNKSFLCLDPPRFYKRLGGLLRSSKSARDSLFPKKTNLAAGVKVNIRFGPLFRALALERGTVTATRWAAPFAGLYNDQATAGLLYCITLEKHMGELGVRAAQCALLQPDNAKGFSSALKALGANTSFPGCLLVEAASLQGRDVGSLDMDKEVAQRCDPDLVSNLVISSAEEMAPHIKAILDIELPTVSPMESLEDFWTSRWLWCVNGAQNSMSDRALNIPRPPGSRRYRRMASEECTTNPIPDWDGTTFVSGSRKLECGKTRAIFACDTRSYFAFSWLLNSAQRDWRGHRVILNPGVGGLYGVAQRVIGSMGRGGVNLMMDYDDFNSHHSIPVQQELFRQTAARYNCPTWYTDKLVDSFDKMYIHHAGVDRKVLGTMMSGHRGTSYINSVLNAAYVRASIGGPAFDKLVSLHSGDDIYVRAPTLSSCDDTLRKCGEFGCRLQPSKQSIGFNQAEFLRLGIGKRYAVGYVARSLATLVAGAWDTPDPLSPEAGLTSAISTTRTCLNRGSPLILSRLVARAYGSVRGYSLGLLDKLLTGDAAIEGSPVYNTDYRINTYRVERIVTPDKIIPPAGHGTNATLSFLECHVQPIEATAIQMAKADLTALMLGTSYSKGVVPQQSPVECKSRPAVRKLPRRMATGFVHASALLRAPPERGCLAPFPLIRLIEKRLSKDDLRNLIGLAGGDTSAKDLETEAFGPQGHSCNVIGVLPFADASSYSKRTTSDNIVVNYNVYS